MDPCRISDEINRYPDAVERIFNDLRDWPDMDEIKTERGRRVFRKLTSNVEELRFDD